MIVKTKRIPVEHVQPGSLVVCHGHVVREVEWWERGQWDDGAAYRFTFTDDHSPTWLEVRVGERVTVVKR